MAILVTGGLGYVGSHAVKLLVDRGEQVICLDNLIFGHKQSSSGSEVIVGDIGDQDLLRKIFSANKIDSVMHFAAFAAVGESVENPQKYYLNNISNSLAMLQVMLEFDVKLMIFSSSAATFGEPETVPIVEEHPQNPTNPYGRSKLMLEHILKEYEHAYGLRSISLRYFNAAGADPSGLIGEDHTPEHHLIPLIIKAAMGQRPQINIFGTDWPTPDGTCIRDYIHVTDLAQAHALGLDALRQGKSTTAYNLGNGSGYSVMEVIKMVEKVSGRPVKAVADDRRPGDPAVLVASSKKISEELGWKPNYPELETIVKSAWEWHSGHPDGYGK
ncbi:MAG: UDP-glucose 4-epimerase GalE [Armatimonadetes bacterium]|jgi:UDP-glucose 4-epimerase|nr:UDP-glucose 4-epimerase GalE [Armatimonadota bacterium]